MDEVRIDGPRGPNGDSGPTTYSDHQIELLIADKQAARNQRFGFGVIMAVLVIIAGTIVLCVLAANGVFGG